MANENTNTQNENKEREEAVEKVLNFSYANDIDSFFEDFLKKGMIVEEKEIVEGLKIKLKVLNTEELLIAESILLTTNPNIPVDIVEKIRAASILSQAIISVNGIPIEKENDEKRENNKRRDNLYRKILTMPAIVIQKIYTFYVDCVYKQNDIYKNVEKVNEDIQNF